MSSISTRKKDHIDLTLKDSSQYKRPTGFQKFHLKHNALPECGLEDISFRSHLCHFVIDFVRPCLPCLFPKKYTRQGKKDKGSKTFLFGPSTSQC